MNQAIKKAWIEALLSGQYKQGRGHLHSIAGNGHQFCCLGVLTDIAVKSGMDLEYQKWTEDNETIVSYDGQDEFLPSDVMRWANIRTDNGAFHYTDEMGTVETSLAELNDQGITFTELVEYIDKYM